MPGERNNNIRVNENKAMEIETKILKKLENEKKLILILDLDNTLLHSI